MDGGSCRIHGAVEGHLEPSEDAGDASAIAPPAIPGYQVSRLLGAGGYAAVFEAHPEAGGDPVALKVGHSGEARAWQRFAREAAALARIAPPFVPGLISGHVTPPGAGDSGDAVLRPFLVMELVTAPVLADWLGERSAPPEPQTAIALMDALAAALEATHAAGVVHRDLKPENAFLHRAYHGISDRDPVSSRDRARPFIKLFDFGLASVGDDPLSAASEAAGSVEYMAPEQIDVGAAVDHRADIYGFGCMAFELVTLRPPFVGSVSEITEQKTTKRPPRPRSFAAVPESLEQLILACLARDRARRPGTASELRAMLARCDRNLSSGRETLVTRADGPPGPRRTSRGHQAVVLLGATTPMGLRDLEKHLGGTGGLVVRSGKQGFVCAFSGFDLDDPISAAATAARQLHDAGARTLCLHLDRVLVRRGDRGRTRLYGAAIERPETWLESSARSGVAATDAIADLIPAQVAARLPGFRRAGASSGRASSPRRARLRSRIRSIPLIGRESMLETILGAGKQVIGDRRPGLITVLGAAGLGKSRLMAHVRTAILAEWRRAGASEPAIVELDAQRSAANPIDLVAQMLEQLTAESRDLTPVQAAHEVARRTPLAIFLDNGHLAHDRVLDAVEQITLDGLSVPILAVVAADPRLDDIRLRWGQRAYHHERLVLQPLTESEASRLCEQLLWPVEYPPTEVLGRLARWSGGVPGVLAELVNTLKREGHIKQRAGTDSWYVATTTLDSLPASPAREWLVGRTASTWPRELAAFAGLCACLGPGIRQNEIEWIQERMEVAGEPLSDLDAQVGIEALVDRDILVDGSRGYHAFRSESFRDAAYRLIDEQERRRAHGYALAYWRQNAREDDPDSLRIWARHAAVAGDPGEAARLHLALADRAAARHRYVEADQHFSATLDALAESGKTGFPEPACGPTGSLRRDRIHALWGRSRMRCRTYRLEDALGDIAVAIDLATEAAGERSGALPGNRADPADPAISMSGEHLLARLWLEKAMIQDWAEDFSGSRESGDKAAEIAGEHRDATGLRARLGLAHARQLTRASQLEQAIPVLVDTIELARIDGDIESRIIALVLLAPYLVVLGHADRARPRFDEVIELCREHGDTLHLCAAHANRMLLWTYTGQPENAVLDLRRATRLARKAGIPSVERAATFNLAELLYWLGHDEEALEKAELAKRLQERFVGERLADDDVLLARILLSLGHHELARTRLDDLAWHNPPTDDTPLTWLLFRALSLALAHHGARPVHAVPGDSWDAVIDDARERLGHQERIEILYWRLRDPGQPPHGEAESALAPLRAELDELIRDAPIWRTRVTRLS